MKNILLKALLFIMLILPAISKAELWIYSDEEVKGSKLRSELPDIAKRDFYSYISNTKPEMSYGKDVLAVEAVEQLRPNDEWIIRIDTELDSYLISWKGGLQWYEILESIDKQTPLNVYINHDEKVIGVSLHEKALPYLSMRKPMLWRLREDRTLKENLELWAFAHDLELLWRSSNDYPIAAPTTFYGELTGEGGAIEKVITAVNHSLEKKARLGFYIDSNNQSISIYEIAHANKQLIN